MEMKLLYTWKIRAGHQASMRLSGTRRPMARIGTWCIIQSATFPSSIQAGKVSATSLLSLTTRCSQNSKKSLMLTSTTSTERYSYRCHPKSRKTKEVQLTTNTAMNLNYLMVNGNWDTTTNLEATNRPRSRSCLRIRWETPWSLRLSQNLFQLISRNS